MKLIEVRDRDGTCLGVCDQRCYESYSPICCCICEGENHSVGLKAAKANTLSRWSDWYKTFRIGISPKVKTTIHLHSSIFTNLIY